MGSIPLATSRQVAVDRVITVLQAQLTVKLDELLSDPENGIGEMNLQGADNEAYYYLPQPVEEIAKNRFPCVFVFPSSPRRLESQGSNGPLGQMQFRDFELTAIFIFKRDGGVQFERLGKTLTTDDVMWLRGEFYTGALAETIRAFACEGDSIHKIELIDDTSDVIYTDQRKVYGVAHTVWTVTQKILAPRRQKLP